MNKRLFAGSAVLAVLLFAGAALATIYYPSSPITLAVSTVSNPTVVYSGNLLAYGDVDLNANGAANCSEFEFDSNASIPGIGPNPLVGGYTVWVDGGVSHGYPDTCSGTHVIELMCGANTLVSGVSPGGAVVGAVQIDCALIPGKTTCATVFGASKCV